MAENAEKLVVFCRFQSNEFQCTKHNTHKPDTKQHEKHYKIRSKPNMKPQTQRETTASRSFITLGSTHSPYNVTRHETHPTWNNVIFGAIFSCNNCRNCEPGMTLPRATTMLFHVGFGFIGGLWSSETWSKILGNPQKMGGLPRRGCIRRQHPATPTRCFYQHRQKGKNNKKEERQSHDSNRDPKPLESMNQKLQVQNRSIRSTGVYRDLRPEGILSLKKTSLWGGGLWEIYLKNMSLKTTPFCLWRKVGVQLLFSILARNPSSRIPPQLRHQGQDRKHKQKHHKPRLKKLQGILGGGSLIQS